MEKIKIIEPFIHSIKNAFETICGKAPESSSPEKMDNMQLKTEKDFFSDIAAVIALPGSIIGSLAVAFKNDTAIKIASEFMEENYSVINDAVKDVIGEIANTVAGNIKSDLHELNFDTALPNILLGSDKALDLPEQFTCYNVKFISDFGPFELRVSIYGENF